MNTTLATVRKRDPDDRQLIGFAPYLPSRTSGDTRDIRIGPARQPPPRRLVQTIVFEPETHSSDPLEEQHEFPWVVSVRPGVQP